MPKGFSKRADKALEMVLSEIRSASSPGLANQIKIDSHDLGHIEVAAPGKDIETDCPDEKLSPGLSDVLVHESLPVEHTPAAIDGQSEHQPREQCTENSQADQDHHDTDRRSLDEGFAAVSHVLPARNQGHYDTNAADHFLEVLGFDRHEPVILSAGGKDSGTNNHRARIN